MRTIGLVGFIWMSVLVLPACSSWQLPKDFDDSGIRARSVTATVENVTLSAAVLSAEENWRLFGVEIDPEEVQPVWIEVDNNTDHTLHLLRSGTDPDLYSPLEVAWSFHRALSPQANDSIDRYFHSLAFQNPIPPNASQAGIIFANPHSQVRLLNVDILGQGKVFPFTLYPKIPGQQQESPIATIFERLDQPVANNFPNLDSLREALQQLPCCSSNAEGSSQGRPINAVLIGSVDAVSAALVRRGYRNKRTVLDNEQRVYGRSPDMVLRKAGPGITYVNWVRVWVAPFRYQGQPVLLAQLGRPVGGRFAESGDDDSVPHPNVDEVRNRFMGDMMYSGSLHEIGFVDGVGQVDREQPRQSFDGSAYFTDGLRVIFFYVNRPADMSEVKILDWYPAIKLQEEHAQ